MKIQKINDKVLSANGKILKVPQAQANLVPLVITDSDINQELPPGADGFYPAKADIPFYKAKLHTDENGIWHKPEEWDDIESMEFDATDSVLYYLIDPHAYADAFIRLRIYGTTCKASYGRVHNGVYTILSGGGEEVSVASGGYYEKTNLDDLDEDYIVVRVTGNPITYVTIYAKSTDPKITAASLPILMRYGNLPNATSASAIASYYLESDNIVNFMGNVTSKSFSLGSYYASCLNLQRVRIGGWNIKNQKVTTFASMFSGCNYLSDIDTLDLTGWVTSSATSITSMFATCWMLKGTLNVSNWDVSNITTMASTFSTMYSIDHIVGLDTWNEAGKTTTAASMFSACEMLKTPIDISSWNLGNGTANLTTVASMFSNCWRVPSIKFGNINLSKCTTVASTFADCRWVEEIEFDNVTPISETCTNAGSLFKNCYSLKELPNLTGWDFSKATIVGITSTCVSLKRIDFTGCTPSTLSTADSSGASPLTGCINVEYIDLTGLISSFRNFTGTYMHSGFLPTACKKVKTLILPSGFYKALTISPDCLPHDCLINILNALDSVTGSIKCTIGSINKSKLTATEQAIATGKGWTLA